MKQTPTKWRAFLPAALAAASLGACRLTPEAAAPATPPRSSVSSDTTTTAEGTLELEAGLAFDPDDSLSTPLTLKYGAGPRTELFAGLSPLNRIELPGDDGSGIGDTVLGLRHRFAELAGGRPALAVQPSLKLPTGDEDEELGSGEVDAGLALIASRPLGAGTVTGFYELGLLGDPNGGGDVAHVLALAGGVPLDGRLGAGFELAGRWVPEQDDDTYLATLCLAYAVSPVMVLDLGVVAGLESDDPDAALLVGLTRNLGRLERP